MTVAIPTTPGIGDVLARRGKARTGTPCWRDSYDVGDRRCAEFVHAVDRAEAGAMIQAVEEWDDREKGAGQRCGPLRTKGVRVYRYLLGQAAKHGGLCCPSHVDVAAACRMAVSAVKATLRALRMHGFLDWRRRTVVADDGEAGPRRKQTTNLYRFTLPRAVAWRARQLLAKARMRVRAVRTVLTSIAGALTPGQVIERAHPFMVAEAGRKRGLRAAVDRALARFGPADEGQCPEPPSATSIARN